MQDNDLSEFDESREIIESLVDEYKACESPDYIKWGMEVSLLQFQNLVVNFIWIAERIYAIAGYWRGKCCGRTGF